MEGYSQRPLIAKVKIVYIVVKQDIPEACKKVPVTNTMLWTGNYANAKVPDLCKSTYVHTIGNLLPIQIDEDITTYGELEILDFIKKMQTDYSMMLIDACRQEIYDYRTIPRCGQYAFPSF